MLCRLTKQVKETERAPNSTEHALDRPRAGELAACDKFWADARARLGRLYRLSDRDLDEIESLLTKRIPKPVAGKPQIRIRTQILYRSLRWPIRLAR